MPRRLAVQNLVKNSLEALGSGGRITVSTACDGKAAMVCVADDGPGIPADTADRVFERSSRPSRGAPDWA